MRRGLLILLVAIGLAPISWLHGPPPRAGGSQSVVVTALSLPAEPARTRGPFRLDGAWELTSANWLFGGYSGLIVPSGGKLLAFTDGGATLDLPEPGSGGLPVLGEALPAGTTDKMYRDVEAATRDRATGTIWLALEHRNALVRLDHGRRIPIAVPAMHDWSDNTGPEAMVRLSDGRFMILSEDYAGLIDWSAHPGLLYAGEPNERDRPTLFRFIGPSGYRPTDMAELPDGRVLILMRSLRWPLPPRFGTAIVLADPEKIRPNGDWRGTVLAGLDGTGLQENYEGLAIERMADGRLAVWLISDANGSDLQRTLLLRLILRPGDLPAKQKAPG